MCRIADRQELTKRDMISLTTEASQISRKIVPGPFVGKSAAMLAALCLRVGPGAA